MTEMICEVAGQEEKREAAATLSSLFAQVCERFGERTAVSLGTESVTYAELNERAGWVAGELQARGVTPGAIVAIYLERSIDLVAAMLGVIQAGAAYLPIDASYPQARVLETLGDAMPAVVVTTRELAGRLGSAGVATVMVEEPGGVRGQGCVGSADDLAYVIYTSGSTGKPKGVMVSHRNVTRLLSETERWFRFNEHDVWTMFHSFAFDFSVWEMWGCLLYGGRLVLVPFEVSRSPEEFYALLAREGVTVLNQTPSALSLLIQAEGRGVRLPLRLRTIVLGGEALNLRSLLPWFERHGDAMPEIINMYGITETTVHVTYRRITAADAERETDSLIGQPIADLRIHLLDEQLQPVADGETGEMCIGGAGVATGYLHREELTAERFVANPFGGEGAKLYRSGDLARRRADGELVYLGRADRQVKINGFRIELGEIEAAMMEFPGLAQACVTTYAEGNGALRLAAYFVSDDAIETKVLSEFLSARLPAQMRPAFYTRLAALPMTSNGKVDRGALPSPVTQASMPAVLSSAMETTVASAWRRALGFEGVGLEDNFFDVGGTSLLLIAVRNALQQELGRTIPITWFFESTTVRSLASRLDKAPVSAVAVTNKVQENAQRQREAFARMKAARSVVR
jgi:amino acid adenylation domain-containing protein